MLLERLIYTRVKFLNNKEQNLPFDLLIIIQEFIMNNIIKNFNYPFYFCARSRQLLVKRKLHVQRLTNTQIIYIRSFDRFACQARKKEKWKMCEMKGIVREKKNERLRLGTKEMARWRRRNRKRDERRRLWSFSYITKVLWRMYQRQGNI